MNETRGFILSESFVRSKTLVNSGTRQAIAILSESLNHLLNQIIPKHSLLLFSKDALNSPKVKIKTFIKLQMIFISNKCFSFECSLTNPERK